MTDKIYMTTMPTATTVGFSQVMTIVQNKYIYSGERDFFFVEIKDKSALTS